MHCHYFQFCGFTDVLLKKKKKGNKYTFPTPKVSLASAGCFLDSSSVSLLQLNLSNPFIFSCFISRSHWKKNHQIPKRSASPGSNIPASLPQPRGSVPAPVPVPSRGCGGAGAPGGSGCGVRTVPRDSPGRSPSTAPALLSAPSAPHSSHALARP